MCSIMIIVKMIGGLGNQMFQIAYARQISMETGEDIYIDKSVYDKYKIRSFSLDNLKISDQLKDFDVRTLSLSENIKYMITTNFYRFYQKLVKVLLKTDVIGGRTFKTLVKIGYYYNFDRYYYYVDCSNSNKKYLYGYFQSESYFEKNKHDIIKELHVNVPLTKSEQEILQEINSCNSIAISMRLGDDYLKSKYLDVCSIKYYKKAIITMKEKYPDSKLFVFSDCIDRARSILKDENCIYIEGFTDYQSLRLMYSCKHFIISNSSFAWWGAYLSSNHDKTILAPNIWYKNSTKTPDIFHSGMTLIDV